MNNVFLNSVNRGTTLHGVEYLRIIKNVYYNTKGHTVFVEDGVETKNRIEYNLVINTEPSFSLLNTDTTPACYWITNPDNIFVGNHCAGSDHYGFWFDMPGHPTGPSATRTICPMNVKLGEFRDNVAHSLPKYGLRVFHGHSPRAKPCEGISYDPDNLSDPFAANPLIHAYYENFVAYKCERNGVIGGNFGAVTLRNIASIDSGVAGIEIERVVDVPDLIAKVEDSIVVGRSEMDNEVVDYGFSPHGVISPRTDRWSIENVRFYNFDFNTAAAIGTCSHCFIDSSTDSDARTVKVSNLQFSNVDRRVKYQKPDKGILWDLDGSLTDLQAGSWATSYWKHNADQPECDSTPTTLEKFGGIICDNTVQVRRIVFHGARPGNLRDKYLYVLPYDDSIVDGMTEAEIEAYEGDDNNFEMVRWRPREAPMEHWAVPFVTGKKYYLRWEYGLDFE